MRAKRGRFLPLRGAVNVGPLPLLWPGWDCTPWRDVEELEEGVRVADVSTPPLLDVFVPPWQGHLRNGSQMPLGGVLLLKNLTSIGGKGIGKWEVPPSTPPLLLPFGFVAWMLRSRM